MIKNYNWAKLAYQFCSVHIDGFNTWLGEPITKNFTLTTIVNKCFTQVAGGKWMIIHIMLYLIR